MDKTGKQSEETVATVHLAGDKADVQSKGSDSVGTVKAKAMAALKVAEDANVMYPIKFDGKTVADEGITLVVLAGGKLPIHMTFQLGKVPKGG